MVASAFLATHWCAPAGLFVEFPLVLEQVLQIVIAPLGRGLGPGDFQAAGDRVTAFARAEGALPAEALLFERCGFRLGTDMRRRAGAVCLAKGVAAGDERHCLLVVHRHAREGLANIPRCGDRIGFAVGAFRVDVDEAHLHGRERLFEIPVAGVAFVSQPSRLGTPIDVVIRLPDVLATASETEGFEAHRFEGDVARQDHQVGPGNLAAILLLDRPE